MSFLSYFYAESRKDRFYSSLGWWWVFFFFFNDIGGSLRVAFSYKALSSTFQFYMNSVTSVSAWVFKLYHLAPVSLSRLTNPPIISAH